MRVFLSILLLLVASHGIHPFAPRPAMARARCGAAVLPLMARFSPNDDDKSGVDLHMKEQMEEEEPAATTLEAPKKGLTPVQQVFWVISSIWSYILITLGAVLSLGLLLNLCGFAYQVSWEDGLEIETIGKMREINQFRSVVNSRPPSSLPR
jgi:hypothetical protein